MATPTMRTLLPRDFIAPLKALGKHDWLTWQSRTTGPPSSGVTFQIPDDPSLEEHEDFIFKLQFGLRGDGPNALRMFAISKTLASGPKLLRPTTQQCEALRHVDVNVSLSEYQQPFPAFLVEIPNEFRRRLTEEFAWQCPPFVLNYFDEKTRYLLSYCEHGISQPTTGNIISPRKQFQTIEQALRFRRDDNGPDLQQGGVLQRIACNFGLMLTRFGVREAGPPDPKSHARNKRQLRSPNFRKARRAQAFTDASFNQIEFEQDVVFCSDDRSSNGPSNPSGRQNRTHWRRGHFRRQRCGAGLEQTKLVFIRPCLINPEHFDGDLADTEYRISARDVSRGGASCKN